MKVKDNVYGTFEIKEPVLLKLLKSPSVFRLKKISQYGVPDKYHHLKNYSRFEHSVGVMLLLRKLGATLEEQVAGLLHDVSVLAFSHIADWVFSDGEKGNENYHDQIHEAFINKTEIPDLLRGFGFSLGRILNDENFPLLENNIPNLCADRIDYSLREFKYWLNPSIVKNCISDLVNYNGEIVFASEKEAFIFATNFLELQTQNWGNYEAVARYHLFSTALKRALKFGVIHERDFFGDESTFLAKLEKAKDKKIQDTLEILKESSLNIQKKSGKRIVKKFRYVDPKIISNDKLIRLSKLSRKFQQKLEKHRKINRRGIFV